jgi:hypothetical protein
VVVAAMAVVSVPCLPTLATEADALAVSANIRARHMPFGTSQLPLEDFRDGEVAFENEVAAVLRSRPGSKLTILLGSPVAAI